MNAIGAIKLLLMQGFFWPSAKKLKGLKTQTQGFWHQNSRIFRLKTQQTGKSLKQKLPVMKCEVHNVNEIGLFGMILIRTPAIFGNSSQNSRTLWKLKPKLKNFMKTQGQILPKTQYFGKSSLLRCPKSGQKKSLE